MQRSTMAGLTCATCGEVEVAVASVEVHINRREDIAVLAFPCPRCHELVVAGCRRTIERLLAAGAVRYELRSTSAPALTSDDLLDLHEWLERDEPWPAPPTA